LGNENQAQQEDRQQEEKDLDLPDETADEVKGGQQRPDKWAKNKLK